MDVETAILLQLPGFRPLCRLCEYNDVDPEYVSFECMTCYEGCTNYKRKGIKENPKPQSIPRITKK